MFRETNVMPPTARSLSLRDALHRLVTGVQDRVQTYRRNRDRRDAFLNLLRLDDALLDDIGITRAEVAWAARLPLGINASDALAVKADARKHRDAD